MRLRLLNLVVQLLDAFLEAIVTGGQVVVFLVVGSLIQSYVRVFVDVLLDGIGDDLRFFQQFVPLGFLLGGVKEQCHHFAAVGDDRILCGQQLVCRRQEGILNLLAGQVRSATVLPAVVLVIALPDYPAILVG